MAGLYFADREYIDLDARGCADVLRGYIDHLTNEPNFSLIIRDDLTALHSNNCWHIKRTVNVKGAKNYDKLPADTPGRLEDTKQKNGGYSMKRTFLICCLLAFALLLCSCGNAIQEKQYLEQDEYGIYQGEEFVTSCADLGYLGDRCQVDWISSLFDIPVEDLNTKRGIHIGSTLDEIATAYEGIHFTCSTQDIYDESIETFVQSIDTSESFEIATWTYFETRKYMLGEGVPVSDEKELSELETSGTCLQVRLIFKVEDAVVTDLILLAIEK